MGSSIGGSGSVRSRGGVRRREGPLSEVPLYTSHCYILTVFTYYTELNLALILAARYGRIDVVKLVKARANFYR